MQRFWHLVVLAFLISACSEGSNFNQLFVSDEQKEAVDHLMERGQYYFDKGEFSKAQEYAQKAYDLNNKNEEAANLLGYIYLGMAGLDSFSLIRNLIEQSKTTTTLAETNNSAVESLSKLGGVVGLTDTDKEAMTVDGNQVTLPSGTVVKGVSDNTLFAGLDVKLPKAAPAARTSTSQNLEYINKAITIICPFVEDAAKIIPRTGSTKEDSRHSAANCVPSEFPKKTAAKNHFLWSFSHLAEAIAFNTHMSEVMDVMNARAAKLSQSGSGATVNATQYISGITELANNINVILPTDPTESANSMLTAIFNDLEAASLGFGQIPGIPEDITKQINGALAALKASSKTIEDSANKDSEATALKNQMVGQLAGKIRDEMTQRESEFSAEQKQDACEAYKSVSTEPFTMCP